MAKKKKEEEKKDERGGLDATSKGQGAIVWGIIVAIVVALWQLFSPSLGEFWFVGIAFGINGFVAWAMSLESEKKLSISVSRYVMNAAWWFLVPVTIAMLSEYYLIRSLHLWWMAQYPYVLIPLWIVMALMFVGMEVIFIFFDKEIPTKKYDKEHLNEFVFERKLMAFVKMLLLIPFCGVVVLFSEHGRSIIAGMDAVIEYIGIHLGDIGMFILTLACIAIAAAILFVIGLLWVRGNKLVLERKMRKAKK